MCIRDSTRIYHEAGGVPQFHAEEYVPGDEKNGGLARADTCLLYTSDAADERSSVDLGGRRIIKKKTKDG